MYTKCIIRTVQTAKRQDSRYFLNYIKRLQRRLEGTYVQRVGLLSGYARIPPTVSYLPDRLIFIAFQSAISYEKGIPFVFDRTQQYTVLFFFFLLLFLVFFRKRIDLTDYAHAYAWRAHNSTSPLCYYVNALYYRDNLPAECVERYFIFFSRIS